MSITLNLRYQKADAYGSEIFIASPKYEEEQGGFDTLKILEAKIKDMGLGTFNPIYYNEDLNYTTIRFKHYKGMKLYERNLYTLKFVVKKSKRNDKEYINCFINNIKLHTRATPQDTGQILDMGF
jgi:hypothetical protein